MGTIFVLSALCAPLSGCGSSDVISTQSAENATGRPDPTQLVTEASERSRLEGVWELVSVGYRLVAVTTSGYVGHRYEFEDGRFRVTRRLDGTGAWRPYRLSVATIPGQIEGLVTGFALREQPENRKAIYKIVGNQLHVSISTMPGAPPPTTFVSTSNEDDFEILTFVRQSPLPTGRQSSEEAPDPEKAIQKNAYHRLQPIASGRVGHGKYGVDFHRVRSFRSVLSSAWHDLVDLREVGLLKLRGCSFVGDEEMRVVGSLLPLEQLDLHATDVTDRGVAQLGRLTDLRTLDLSLTDTTDESLRIIRDLESLETVILSGTAVTQQGIDVLRAERQDIEVVWTRPYTIRQRRAAIALSRLELEIDDAPDRFLESIPTACQITIPPNFEVRVSSAPKLPGDYRSNGQNNSQALAASTVASRLAELPAPTVVVVQASDADDSLVASLGNIPGLVRLCLERTRVTDEGLSNLSRYQDLKVLQLTYAERLTDKGVAGLTALRSLEELWIGGIDLTAAGVAPLLKLNSLRVLHVNRKNLPPELSSEFRKKGVAFR